MLHLALRAARFAVVDVETTGVSAVTDRVTEVAAVLVEDGRIVDTFETLVNPGISIPPFITKLTGIDDRLVAGKPRLDAVVPRLREALDGRLFVAHNASFDYSFLKHGFARTGQAFEMDQLCTIKLARRLVPGLRSYRLDALLDHFKLSCRARHRARGDAEATAMLLLHLLTLAEQQGIESLPALLQLQQRSVGGRKPRGVDEAIVQSLPEGPGVYLLKDQEGHVFYAGKSRHVRARVREHLRGEHAGQPRLRRRIRNVADVEAIETGSELEALFLESKLIKRYLPEANVVGRGWRSYSFLTLDTSDPYPRLDVTREPPEQGADVFGPLRRARAAAAAAEYVQDLLGLRRCEGSIRPGMSACALLDLKKCLGPCINPDVGEAYGHAVGRLKDLLDGTDRSLLDQMAARRDALAEELRFEEAIAVRDHLRELEVMLGDQRKLEAVARRNLVVVAPSRQPKAREVFFIRAGRLVDQRCIVLPARSRQLQRIMQICFDELHQPPAIDREVVDEMRHLDDWLRRERSILKTIAIDPASPASAVTTVMEAIRTPISAP